MIKKCTITRCEREHAAHGLCLMHYKRVRKHGSTEYRWGGRIVGRACLHCSRPAAAREMCNRHYQMLQRHGDPLYADKRKRGGMAPGMQLRRGHIASGPSAFMDNARPATDAAITRMDRAHETATRRKHGLRDGSKRNRREWEHRRIAGAKKGEVVHHIDGDGANNNPLNLHVFACPADHTNAHRSLERIAYGLLREGLVVFDRSAGLYRRSPA